MGSGSTLADVFPAARFEPYIVAREPGATARLGAADDCTESGEITP